jgi:hypothetical protein
MCLGYEGNSKAKVNDIVHGAIAFMERIKSESEADRKRISKIVAVMIPYLAVNIHAEHFER